MDEVCRANSCGSNSGSSSASSPRARSVGVRALGSRGRYLRYGEMTIASGAVSNALRTESVAVSKCLRLRERLPWRPRPPLAHSSEFAPELGYYPMPTRPDRDPNSGG